MLMKTEIEARLLEINEADFIQKIKTLGAIFVGDWFMTRKVFDVKPGDDSTWMRLRCDGKTTTLTVKEITNSGIEGTKELEIEVDDFDKTNELLNKLGFFSRGTQTNRRIRYILDDVEIDIDFWPLIPTYVELEAESVQKIKDLCKKLEIDYNQLTTMSVPEVYAYYGKNVREYPDAFLEKSRQEQKFDI